MKVQDKCGACHSLLQFCAERPYPISHIQQASSNKGRCSLPRRLANQPSFVRAHRRCHQSRAAMMRSSCFTAVLPVALLLAAALTLESATAQTISVEGSGCGRIAPGPPVNLKAEALSATSIKVSMQAAQQLHGDPRVSLRLPSFAAAAYAPGLFFFCIRAPMPT